MGKSSLLLDALEMRLSVKIRLKERVSTLRCGDCGQRTQFVCPGHMERNAIDAMSGHWTGERDPHYRPGDEALLMR